MFDSVNVIEEFNEIRSDQLFKRAQRAVSRFSIENKQEFFLQLSRIHIKNMASNFRNISRPKIQSNYIDFGSRRNLSILKRIINRRDDRHKDVIEFLKLGFESLN